MLNISSNGEQLPRTRMNGHHAELKYKVTITQQLAKFASTPIVNVDSNIMHL